MEFFSFSLISLMIDIEQIVSLKVYNCKPALTSLPGTLKPLLLVEKIVHIWTIFRPTKVWLDRCSYCTSEFTPAYFSLCSIKTMAVWWKVGDSYINQRCTSANSKHGCSFVALRCMILFRIPSILYTTTFCREHAFP